MIKVPLSHLAFAYFQVSIDPLLFSTNSYCDYATQMSHNNHMSLRCTTNLKPEDNRFVLDTN